MLQGKYLRLDQLQADLFTLLGQAREGKDRESQVHVGDDVMGIVEYGGSMEVMM